MSDSDIVRSNNRLLTGAIALFGIITIIFILFDPMIAGIPAVVCGVLVLSLLISRDAASHMRPKILAKFSPDARSVIIENLGNQTAINIRTRILPEDIRFNSGDLDPDNSINLDLPDITPRLKVYVSWEDERGKEHESVFTLSALEEESDPLRPMIPLFSWKEEEKD